MDMQEFIRCCKSGENGDEARRQSDELNGAPWFDEVGKILYHIIVSKDPARNANTVNRERFKVWSAPNSCVNEWKEVVLQFEIGEINVEAA